MIQNGSEYKIDLLEGAKAYHTMPSHFQLPRYTKKLSKQKIID